jgi:hypothetical protein
MALSVVPNKIRSGYPSATIGIGRPRERQHAALNALLAAEALELAIFPASDALRRPHPDGALRFDVQFTENVVPEFM